MALAVLENKTVDGTLWAEAVEWLMLYGPPEIRALLDQASNMATNQEFPQLSPVGTSPDGGPLYDIAELAETLGISEEEATTKLQQREKDQRIQHLFTDDDSMKIQ